MQKFGVDVLPRHFYSEIPSFAKLRSTRSWRRPYSLQQIQGIEIEGQLQWLESLFPEALHQHLQQRDLFQKACARNGDAGYGHVEADTLFAFVCAKKPEQVVQIGCGVSTAVILEAAAHCGYKPDILCVEPYPNNFLSSAEKSGDIRLLPEPVEEVKEPFYEHMGEGDLFFSNVEDMCGR